MLIININKDSQKLKIIYKMHICYFHISKSINRNKLYCFLYSILNDSFIFTSQYYKEYFFAYLEKE